jgi:hypothetical protein
LRHLTLQPKPPSLASDQLHISLPNILSSMQRQILDKLRDSEKGIDKEVEEVIAERRRCKELMVGTRCRAVVVGFV